MQHGDLETWTSHRIILILEGVLATVTPVIEAHRIRRDEIVGWDLDWHDLPLKRIVAMRQQYPDVAFDIVSFTNQDVIDLAAEYLQAIPIPYDTITLADYRTFCSTLRFHNDINQVIDSDPDRLHNYGQLGRQVMPGGDWG